MLELHHDNLKFSFPKVHKDARMSINFQRTLRIPDDDQIHSLPPGLGCFPLRHVDDFAARIPENWREHGGVMMPMFQSEAMWVDFNSSCGYPFLVKISTGKINAVTGDDWNMQPVKKPQDYLVVPEQPWIDGYCVEKDLIRQFVAMPLGSGYTVEEQISGQAEHGGVQVLVYPMKGSVWDLNHVNRCFVHISNSINWRAITGEAPPTIPPTARQYTEAGLPWFNHYRPDSEVVGGIEKYAGVQSVLKFGEGMGENPLPENEGIELGYNKFTT